MIASCHFHQTSETLSLKKNTLQDILCSLSKYNHVTLEVLNNFSRFFFQNTQLFIYLGS